MQDVIQIREIYQSLDFRLSLLILRSIGFLLSGVSTVEFSQRRPFPLRLSLPLQRSAPLIVYSPLEHFRNISMSAQIKFSYSSIMFHAVLSFLDLSGE
jgi:hypothetical protein